MATFTIALKDAVAYQPDIGLNHYPLFDEKYRGRLNQKILDHFWNQEIGQETIEMFRLALSRKMNEIMPLYNQRYVSEMMKFDPMDTVDIETFTDQKTVADTTGNQTGNTDTTNTGESVNASTSGAKSRTVQSDTPQTRLAGDGDYATAAQDNVSETSATGKVNEDSNQAVASTSDDTGHSEQDSTGNSKTRGFQGNRTLLLMQYRESFLNVDMEIITELESAGLFMLVWDNGDSYTERENHLGYGLFGYGFPF